MTMTDKEKITQLSDKDFNYFEIADLLGMTYEQVRTLSEDDY